MLLPYCIKVPHSHCSTGSRSQTLHPSFSLRSWWSIASTPGSLGGGEREPGTHCLRMRQDLRKHLRKTIRLLPTSTWFIYVYVVYQVQIRRLNKISARSSSLWLSKDYIASKRIEVPENNRSIPRKRLCDPGKPTRS